ncbi:MAG: hypothetical protein AAF497_17050 [Planctomycetota bacterium]
MKRILCIIAMLVAGFATTAQAGHPHHRGNGRYVNRNVNVVRGYNNFYRGGYNNFYRGGYNNFYRGGTRGGLSISIGNPGFVTPVYGGWGGGWGGGFGPGFGVPVYGGRPCGGGGVGFSIGF